MRGNDGLPGVDMERNIESMEAYEAALLGDRNLADCHYNLALLCEDLKKPKEAIQQILETVSVSRKV